VLATAPPYPTDKNAGVTVLTDMQERLLRHLATEHKRFLSMPLPEKPVLLAHPLPALELLSGISAGEVDELLGESDYPVTPASDGSQTWRYDFSRRPSGYRGGGLLLELRFGADSTCLGAQWRPQR
jgi:hypothetical protein